MAVAEVASQPSVERDDRLEERPAASARNDGSGRVEVNEPVP
jgi:hypothetical protein